MELNEFKKKSRSSYDFDRWVRDKTVATPLGDLTVDFQIHRDRNPPDDEMLKRAAELVRYMEQHGDYVLDVVFAAYLWAGRKGYLEFSRAPKGLTRENVCKYLEKKDRSLVVTRDPDSDEIYESAIFFTPKWDEEHALSLDFRDGQIVSANGDPFRLVDGVLRYEWEDDKG